MKSEQDGWEPMLESQPSDNFQCNYEGNFAQTLLLNRPAIEKFLSIASLDGRFLLNESRIKKPQPVPDGINPDGSVAGRGSLRWGQKIEVEGKKVNPYFQLEPDDIGWVTSINGNLISEDLMKKPNTNARNVAENFASKFEHYLRKSLFESLIKDKCTLTKDPFLTGRLVISFFVLDIYRNLIMQHNFTDYILTVLYLSLQYSANTLNRVSNETERDIAKAIGVHGSSHLSRVINFSRRTVDNRIEACGLPFEADRLILANGYLIGKSLSREKLVRAAPH